MLLRKGLFLEITPPGGHCEPPASVSIFHLLSSRCSNLPRPNFPVCFSAITSVSSLTVERRSILEQHQRELRYLRDVAVAVEQNHAREEHEATLNFQSARDEIKNKSLQEKQYSRLQLSGKLEGLWEQFQHAVRCYAEATEHRKLSFEALKVKDEKSSREVEVQEKKLQKLQDAVLAAKARLAAHLHECEEQNQRMRERKEAAMEQLQQLKSEMSRAQAKAHRSLAELTAQSGAALKALGKIVGKAERVLRLAELCRRMESEEEKVLPFYPSSLAEGEQDDAERVLREAPTEPLAQVRGQHGGPGRRGGMEAELGTA
uniref:Uncharacterized protein n=1 Tax=Meleagris gallopavo TaxID=9103 RepID=H9H0Z1_MELGA